MEILEIPDINREVEKLVRQVPEGKVSTYSAIARALGDVRAARAVAAVVGNLSPGCNPHRILYADGGVPRNIGNIGSTQSDVRDLLRREGIDINNGIVPSLESRLFEDFRTTFPLKTLRRRQKLLARKIRLVSCRDVKSVAGLDVAYRGEIGVGAAAVFDMESGKMTGAEYASAKVSFPYIPTYLFYREFPVIEKIAGRLDEGTVLLLDGNGILHPFGIGVASQAGVELDRITVGAAKSLLCGKLRKVPEKPGAHSPIYLGKKMSGHCLKPGPGREKLYISPGNKITVRESLNIVAALCKGGREHPLLAAHKMARAKAIGKTVEKRQIYVTDVKARSRTLPGCR